MLLHIKNQTNYNRFNNVHTNSKSYLFSNKYRNYNNSISTKMNNNLNSKPNLKGIVFDLDGTLTIPVLDFKVRFFFLISKIKN